MEDLKEQTKINFNDIISIKKITNDQYIFNLKNNKKIIQNEVKEIVEPTLDPIFKSIFTDEKEIDGINGKKRLLSLLNSILLPGNEESKFTEIIFLPNESNEVNRKINNFRFDIVCQAKLEKKNEIKLINIEMQLGKDTTIINRLFKYASDLYRANDTPTIVLGFINTKSEINVPSSSIQLYEKDPNGNIIQCLNFIQIITINIKKEIMKIVNNEKIYVNEKELDEKGINWIKFFGLRYWAYLENNFYLLPKNMKINSKEISSAYFMILKENVKNLKRIIEDEQYINTIFNEQYKKGIEEGKKEGIEEGKKEGKKEGIKEGIKNGKLTILVNLFHEKKEDLTQLLSSIINNDDIFAIDEIKKMFNDEQKCNSFIELLGKKRISEKKNK